MRKTKLVCTLGPSSHSFEQIKSLAMAGLNVARFNCSHGSINERKERFDNVKKVNAALGLNIALMLDTKGPEIRTGKLKDKKVQLVDGKKAILTTDEIEGSADKFTVSWKKLPLSVKKGDKIFIADGLLEFDVEKVDGNEVHCKIIVGGILGEHKNVNIPNVDVDLPTLAETDKNDVAFGLEWGMDLVAQSFVRGAKDVEVMRKLLKGSDVQIIAKIEDHRAIANLDEILQAADGIMVARGDLGVQVPLQDVPIIQKRLVASCKNYGKPVIVATQMLESMINNPHPTRAEISDVANAVFDGADAVMLSGETAAGKYPLRAVQTMDLICHNTERYVSFKWPSGDPFSINDAMPRAALTLSHDLHASAVITPTAKGSTAKRMSNLRPPCDIIALTPDERVARKLSLYYGVTSIIFKPPINTSEMIAKAIETVKGKKFVKKDDLIVITAGVPLGTAGSTNMVKVEKVV